MTMTKSQSPRLFSSREAGAGGWWWEHGRRCGSHAPLQHRKQHLHTHLTKPNLLRRSQHRSHDPSLRAAVHLSAHPPIHPHKHTLSTQQSATRACTHLFKLEVDSPPSNTKIPSLAPTGRRCLCAEPSQNRRPCVWIRKGRRPIGRIGNVMVGP